MNKWLVSARLRPLLVGVGPVLLAVAFAQWQEPDLPFSYLLNGAIIACVFLIQVATHFFNDALDFTKGADGELRQGPKRAVQQGLIKPAKLIKTGVVCLFLAGLIGLYLVWIGGWPIFVVGLVSLSLAYLYTGGPWPLAYTGLADLFVILFFGLVPVGFVFYLNADYFDESAWIAGLQCGFLALNILLVNNLRDEKADLKANKKTLVVRFGQNFGRWEWRLAQSLPYLIGFWWLRDGLWLASFGPFLLLPLSLYMHWLLGQALAGRPVFSRLFGLACLHYAFFMLLLSLIFWLQST